nr:unnamed protein product [Callosobruchus chinensis]
MSPQEELFGYLFWNLRKLTHSPNMLRSVLNIFMKAMYLGDGIRHLRVNAAPIPVHTAFDFAESIRSDSSISIDSDGSPDKHATVSSSESQSEIDILAIVCNEVDPDKKWYVFNLNIF